MNILVVEDQKRPTYLVILLSFTNCSYLRASD